MPTSKGRSPKPAANPRTPRQTSQAKRIEQLEKQVAQLTQDLQLVAYLHTEFKVKLMTMMLKQAMADPRVQEQMIQQALQSHSL